MTQYSVTYPQNAAITTIEALFSTFKQQYDATLIAIDSGNGVELNPSLKREVQPGSKLFYISDERVIEFKW